MRTKEFKIGDSVIYVDEYGNPHNALVNTWWDGKDSMLIQDYLSQFGMPGCNLVFVDPDDRKKDSYGRQTRHETSVVHKTKQAAHGRYWCFNEEF